MKSKPKSSASGFTLVELLVAMAITTLIITILVSVTSLALDTWNRNRSELRASRQGKAMIDSLSRDLESIVIRKGNNYQWLYAKSVPPSGDINGSKSPNAVDLAFFTSATDRYNGAIGSADDNGGDVSMALYRLVLTDPISGTPTPDFNTFALYRKLVNPDETFASILGTEINPGNPDSDELFTKGRSAVQDPEVASRKIDDKANFICENIYQFTMIFDVSVTKPDGTIANMKIPVSSNPGASDFFKVTGRGNALKSSVSGPGLITNDMIVAGRLTSIEVSITVLSDFGLQQMRKRTFTDAQRAEFLAQNSYQYSKLVPVAGG